MDLDNLDPDEVVEAIEEGRRRALLIHKQLGQSVAIWEDGKVVIIPPEEIDLSEPNRPIQSGQRGPS